jgi:hypothetical protein
MLTILYLFIFVVGLTVGKAAVDGLKGGLEG